MSKRIVAIVVALVAALVGGAPTHAQGHDASDAEKLLRQADDFRLHWPSVVVRTRIANYEHGTLRENEEFDVSIKGDSTHVRFLSTRNKGQVLLMRGDDMWFFLPSASRPVRITPIQRLLGNASNGDVARLQYGIDYVPRIAGEEVIDKTACTILELQAKAGGATYQRVRLVVRASDAWPMRADCFLTSGRQAKTVAFEQPRHVQGRTIVTRLVIDDAIRPAERTVMEFLAFTPKDLPDKLFNPARGEGM
jgi:outer membrane lipoprotein-sorting protein